MGVRSGEALDGEIGETRENRSQIVAYGKLEPAAAFHDR